MKATLGARVEREILDFTGRTASIQTATLVGGGCINQAEKILLEDGRQFFVKTNRPELFEMFACEARGLEALRSTNTIQVPTVVAFGKTATESYLILEFISAGKRPADFFQRFGRELARLHRLLDSSDFGFHEDNFIGSTRQPNRRTTNWIEFWSKERLNYQLRLAQSNGLGGKRLQSLGRKLLNRLPQILLTSESRPSLLHGDLWSGNFMSNSVGKPVLIDPAAYFGHREAEFGMTSLFGGFDDAFYGAYNEVFPLEAGSEDRIAIYRLYHLLNHLNLFGPSYLAGCLQILEKYN